MEKKQETKDAVQVPIQKGNMEIGISTFLEATIDPETGQQMSHAKRLRHAVEEIVVAEQAGLDVYGIGEHHRADYAGSAPEIVLAAAAGLT